MWTQEDPQVQSLASPLRGCDLGKDTNITRLPSEKWVLHKSIFHTEQLAEPYWGIHGHVESMPGQAQLLTVAFLLTTSLCLSRSSGAPALGIFGPPS